jgi:hypothetical protein
MKRLQILAMAAVLVLGISSWAGALQSDPLAQFWVYDTNGDHSVSLSCFSVGTGQLSYRIGDSGVFTDIGDTGLININNISVGTGTASSALIQFQLFLNNVYLPATLTFIGNGTNGLWNNVRLNFGGLEYLIATPEGHDYVADHNPASTPIPAAAWLLGSGLLGLIGIGKRGYFGNA